MELCPSTEQTAVEPDERGKKIRTMLHVLYYGEMIVVALRWWALGSLAGVFQLINLWICYTAYATINFCSCFIYFIICFMEFMFIFADFRRAALRQSAPSTDGNTLEDPSTPANGNVPTQVDTATPFLYMAFAYIFLYNVLAMFYSYRAYTHFKWLFQVQHGGAYMDMNDDEGY